MVPFTRVEPFWTENSSTFESGTKIVPWVELSYIPWNGSRKRAVFSPLFSSMFICLNSFLFCPLEINLKVCKSFHRSYYHSGDCRIKAKMWNLCVRWQIGETGKGLDCVHSLVLNNGAPNGRANSIMKFTEAVEVPLFNGIGWANTSRIRSDAFQWLNLQKINSFRWGLKFGESNIIKTSVIGFLSFSLCFKVRLDWNLTCLMPALVNL